ncbi:MAG TPA: gamma-glutamyl-gamma-aminobutyrate hydrolase family protein, partial [Alphaproteobacteria bacterium]|nr:gamma-glutamyl-gamma-aminobutyrate hydrolase family protein [Alphaproteobacteria bacterium]
MIILIDNYDSFTYNLVQYLGDLGAKTAVYRNDQISPDDVFALNPKGIVISPGPSDPDHAGICLDVITQSAARDVPLFGVCLGHQAIGQVFGGKIIRVAPMHG